jgi:hypothetical protein
LRTAGDGALKRGKLASDMIEDAIEDQTQTAAAHLLRQRIEIRAVANW